MTKTIKLILLLTYIKQSTELTTSSININIFLQQYQSLKHINNGK
jgi:hypothetical protein